MMPTHGCGPLRRFLLGSVTAKVLHDVSTAVWTGLGTAGIALIGMLWLNEPRDVRRLICLGLIVSGVVGLRLLESHRTGPNP